MRRLIPVHLILPAVFLLPLGCRRQQPVKVEIIEEEQPKLATIIHVADPKAGIQLIKGFHEIEQNAWRWTAGKFAVALRPPRGAAERGAVLQLKIVVSDAVLARIKSQTLKAWSGNHQMAPETYAQPGEYTYARDVPASLLGGEAVTIEFELDKWLRAGEVDQRDLGLIATTVGLEPK